MNHPRAVSTRPVVHNYLFIRHEHIIFSLITQLLLGTLNTHEKCIMVLYSVSRKKGVDTKRNSEMGRVNDMIFKT